MKDVERYVANGPLLQLENNSYGKRMSMILELFSHVASEPTPVRVVRVSCSCTMFVARLVQH